MDPESRDDFRVAIICALPLEATAVLNLFDQRYDKSGSRYGKQEGDTNTYSTGRIGRHDVVLVHMSGMGPTDAARAASNIRLSFKEVRLALIVGVCGGVPLERSIVLGDVIVSDSIVDFSTGRQYSDGVQARKGGKHMLGRPNPEIRGLLSKLKIPLIRQELEVEVQQNLAELCKKSDTAQYPGVEHDRLFAASYRHMHRKETSSQDCLCIRSQLHSGPVCSEALESSCDALRCDAASPGNPSRRARFALGVPTPFLHIGTIGATTVMKSGEHRDVIARENDVIGFEMEGAGLWDDLPCIIIKGVCDYADSHKNKKWQDYAAATAASAAKAFLGHWTSKQRNLIAAETSSRKRPPLLGGEAEASTSKRGRRQSRSRWQSPMAVPPEHQTSSDILSVPAIGVDVRKARLEALHFIQLDTRHNTIENAHAATCEWFLNNSEYVDWQDRKKLPEHHGFLWIKGKPGAGKSTIMKFAYTHAKKDAGGSIAISYFFNARGEHLEKSTCGMYRSLLFQLLSKLPRLQAVLSTIEAAYLQHTSPDLWTAECLQSLFRKTIERLEGQRLTCFVDALDECEKNEDQVREMVGFFEELGECAVKDKIRLLVCFSSRHYPHITINKSVELTLEIQQGHSDDIIKYVNSKLKVARSKRIDRIKIDVQEKSQGIFLWVVLVIPILKKAWDHGQVDALDKCLRQIPRDLDELFNDMLSRDAQNMESLALCLSWILHAERPLRPEELYFAILSASSSGPVTAWDSEDVTPEDINRFILSSSKGLAEATRSKTPTIQFIHESVRDFLLKKYRSAVLRLGVDCTSPGPAHDVLKKNCQRYLVGISMDRSLKHPEETTKMFPFLDYSVRFVFKHAELAASHGLPQEPFLKQYPLEDLILLHDHIEQDKIRCYGTGTSLLYILTEKNLLHLFRIEVRQSQSINAKGGRYGFPIVAAVAVRNRQMLELLLKHGADLDERHKHAFSIAVERSDTPTFEFLMEQVDMSSWTAFAKGALLVRAVKIPELSIIKLLLRDSGFVAAVKDLVQGTYKTLVDAAIDDQDDDLFRMLIELEVVGPDRYGFGSALIAASRHGEEALVRVFLDDCGPSYAGAYATSSGRALLEAIKGNHDTISRILLEHGTDISALDERGDSALHIASQKGQKTIVRMLLERSADVNAPNDYGSTALHVAARMGQETILRMLPDHGAEVSATGEHGETALHMASEDGHELGVRSLLDNRASINAMAKDHCTALHIASQHRNQTCVQILLEHGADVNEGNSPLDAVIDSRYSTQLSEAILHTLLEHGADPNQHSYLSRNLPLHTALRFGITDFVKLLLDHGADVDIASSKYENASSALKSCGDATKRAACEALLLERNVLQPPETYLTWVGDTPYLNFLQNFPQETLGDTTLHDPRADQASGVD
jgi:ankyrin repeat protein/nucleoside phosphorylase